MIQEPPKVYFIYCNRCKDVMYKNDVGVALSYFEPVLWSNVR